MTLLLAEAKGELERVVNEFNIVCVKELLEVNELMEIK